MNKHAAEKIASEYYNLGIQLALENAGLAKTAGIIPSSGMGRLGGVLGLGTAASLGTGASGEALMTALRSINPKASFDPSKLQAIMQGAKSDIAGYGQSMGGAYKSLQDKIYSLAVGNNPELATLGM